MGLFGYSFSMVGFALSTSVLHFFLTATLLGMSMGLAFTSGGARIAEVLTRSREASLWEGIIRVSISV
jgi:hypothetical protein